MKRYLPRQTGRRVRVHTTDDQSLDGVLASVSRDGLMLRAATVHDETDVKVAGEAFVPREKVLIVQVLPLPA